MRAVKNSDCKIPSNIGKSITYGDAYSKRVGTIELDSDPEFYSRLMVNGTPLSHILETNAVVCFI